MAEHIPNDLISIVERIVQERMKYLYRYSGEVKLVDKKGVATIHSSEFGTSESDPSTWLYCQPGNNMKTFLMPEVGDHVEIYFPSGKPDLPRYSCLDPAYISIPNSIPDESQIIYLSSNIKLYHDVNNNMLIIKGVLPEEFSVKGQSLVTQLNKDLDMMVSLQSALNSWIPIPLDGGAALKAALSGFLGKPPATYINVLSTEVKNS